MAVMSLFKNLDRPLPVREQLDGLAHDLAAELAETRAAPGHPAGELRSFSAWRQDNDRPADQRENHEAARR